MIETPRLLPNANRQLVLVVFAVLLSLGLTFAYPFRLGLDLSGGTSLIYETNIDRAIQRGELPRDVDRVQLMKEMIPIIAERVDPDGITEAVVTQRGESDIMVELPRMTDAEAQQVQRQIETLGSLRMRVVADESYNTLNSAGIKFDLQKERERLQAWLDADNGKNRKLVAEDPLGAIAAYNVLSPSQGGILAEGALRWYPRRIGRDYRDRTRWDRPMSSYASYPVVRAYDDADYAAGPDAMLAKVRERLQQGVRSAVSPDAAEERVALFELVLINEHEEFFRGEDMDASGVRATTDHESGLPAVSYVMNDANKTRYADFSERYRGKSSAIILNNFVHSAPEFRGRIYGTGQITGGFTEQEASDLAKTLKTGSLQVKPTLLSKSTIGATLGAKSIELGIVSILVGGLLVMAFMLFYYRSSGLVAVIGLALNVLLIVGIMQFIRATFTLPGLAGIVLTIGMAVDANILIYERIREEVNRGKALLQAVSAGFDRAMVTILDANITTFLVGMVLFNIGVGPIRGFAVTLMIGIVTSVFTAFFASRLIFHFLLASGWMKSFVATQWFKDFNFDYLRVGKRATLASAIAILFGLGYMLFVAPRETTLGLDFMGGANLKVVLASPESADSIRDALSKNDEFRKAFPNPQINTAGQVVDGKAREFAIKLKLSDTLRDQMSREKLEAEQTGEAHEPLYTRLLRTALQDRLVSDAYSDVVLTPLPNRPSTVSASLRLHFQEPIALTELTDRLKQKHPDVEVRPVAPGDREMPLARDVIVGFDVPASTTASQVFPILQEQLTDLRSSNGQLVKLSSPIPDADEIGGRMVGELRNAAIGAMIVSWFLMIMYVRVRFHEYKYGIAAVAALVHDVLITLGAVVIFNHLGIVRAEIDLAMVAAFLTIVGYSVNDTIVIFDRVRENVSEQARLGDSRESFASVLNRSLNQTLTRTILTTGCTLLVVIAQFIINYNSGSSLEAFAFALFVGMLAGVYSTVFIACPIVLWIRNREVKEQLREQAVPAPTPAQG